MSVIDSMIKEIEFDISVFSDEGFDIKQSIIEAKEIAQKLVEENRWIRGEFEEDYREINRLKYTETYYGYDFSKFDSAQFNHKLPQDFKTIVKCWIINIVDKFKDTSSMHYLIHFTKVLK